MKIFSKTALASLLFLTFFTSKSQDVDLLKAFINKNSVALRSVQKNSMKLTDAKAAENFKDLLKLQLISIKSYNTNKELSYSSAAEMREKSVEFLSKNSAGSTDYYKVTEEEKAKLGAKKTIQAANSYLSDAELKSIEAIDTKDPSLFNKYTIAIQ
ncbi:MAG: hypothetical protein H0U95_19320 [Bacteroidetes bacterium]|nr:hypothetical protein [Bacteroidota bacterium]